jgi:hypothetical protein
LTGEAVVDGSALVRSLLYFDFATDPKPDLRVWVLFRDAGSRVLHVAGTENMIVEARRSVDTEFTVPRSRWWAMSSRLKLVITLVAISLVATHLRFPDLAIDHITLGLLAFAVLPWLSTLFKSIALPGGWKVEFQKIEAAGRQVTASSPEVAVAPVELPAYIQTVDLDPNLALVGLRIEIEKRLRELAGRLKLNARRPIWALLRDFRIQAVLNDTSVNGLQDLIEAGNAAAHGAKVDPSLSQWSIEQGPQILAVLDAKLAANTADSKPTHDQNV